MYSDYEEKEVDVIVIGSGIAGLTTALYIYEREPTLSILVLEAKNRIGGRIVSQSVTVGKNQNSVYDMGGQFFLYSQKPFINLLEKLDVAYVKSDTPKGKILGIFENGTLTTTARPAQFGNVTERIELINFFGQLETLSASICLGNAYSMIESKELDNMTMEEYIHTNLKSRRNKSFVNTLLNIIFGLHTSQISVLYYVAYCNSTDGVNTQFFNSPNDEICWVDGGTYQICERMAEVIGSDNIITGDPVHSVIRKSNFITIKTQNEVYKYAVIAVPPRHILTINFIPSLAPTKVAYLEKLSHGNVVKFIIIYDDAFWKHSNFSGDIYFNYASTPVLACFHMPSKNNAVLCGYVNMQFDKKKRSSWKTLVLHELAKYLGKKTLEPLVYMERQWNEEFPTGCPFSCPGLNTLKDFLEIKRPIGRLYWAGAETSTYWNGHLAGAVHSGYVAAIEVLYELRPQTLTIADIVALRPPRNFISRYNNTLKYKVIKKRNKWVYLIPLGVLTILIIMYTHKKIK